MHKRTITKEDGRYLIFYTFDPEEESRPTKGDERVTRRKGRGGAGMNVDPGVDERGRPRNERRPANRPGALRQKGANQDV